LRWVFEAKKRFGLSVLSYIVTSNHVHLLVKDTGSNVIADSVQLIASRQNPQKNVAENDREHQRMWDFMNARVGMNLGSRLSGLLPKQLCVGKNFRIAGSA
jgi:hypothetical protein